MNETFELSGSPGKSPAFRITRFDSGNFFGQTRRVNLFTVVLLKEATGRVSVDATTYDFSGNTFLSFSLYQPFAISFADIKEGLMAEFHPDFFCLYRHRAEVSCNGILFNNLYESPLLNLSDADTEMLDGVFNGLFTEMQAGQADPDVLLSYLKIMLIAASRLKVSQGGADAGNKPATETALLLRDAIETHFRTTRTAAAYAGILHLSAGAVNRLAKTHFNKTLTDLLTERIVLEAKRELYLTLNPVKAIAHELGFADEFHFSRYFKRNVGISPKMFRDTVGLGKATEEISM